jgi:glutamine synthetase
LSTVQDVQKQLDQDGISFLLAQFVDINGSAKVKMVPASTFGDIVSDGAGFAGAALYGMGQGPNSHDMMARVDIDTYTPLPWREGTARFACDLFVDEKPWMHCPRQNMKRVLADVKKAGFSFQVGIEPEHFLVVKCADGDLHVWDPNNVDNLDKPCYDFKGIANVMDYLQDMMEGMTGLGWNVYQADHEDGNGQYEINFVYTDALMTADRYTFFKMMSSQIAQKYGAIATHMAKPFADRTGSGGHIHYHLADSETRENMFEDDSDPQGLGLSKLAYHFIGGVLAHAPALTAVMSPTVNCYKRLQVGAGLTSSTSGYTWVPASITYGDNNRTQMIRVAGPGNIEDRTVSAACNPYLAFAAYVAAGMDGIARELDPGEPNRSNMYDLSLDEIRQRGINMLPQSLPEALAELKRDEVVQGGLGVIAPDFIELKEAEWSEYHSQVSRWEVDRYLQMF